MNMRHKVPNSKVSACKVHLDLPMLFVLLLSKTRKMADYARPPQAAKTLGGSLRMLKEFCLQAKITWS